LPSSSAASYVYKRQGVTIPVTGAAGVAGGAVIGSAVGAGAGFAPGFSQGYREGYGPGSAIGGGYGRAVDDTWLGKKLNAMVKGQDRADEQASDEDQKKCAGKCDKPYSDPKQRPKYGKDQVKDVWDAAKDENGDVYDPNTGEKLEWDKSKSRSGQWDMGHKPGEEYKKLHDDYMSDRITQEEFMQRYRDPNNYQPEAVSGNRSHRFEQK
ncbi:HNH/ENDO VII family nuclease, partial [Methylobacterium indicum]|uniref:HNH/ENDO VII family nuclease n=2 Tax=Methylobacterium indicum TaxID=1775910 RepID=UPI001A96D349